MTSLETSLAVAGSAVGICAAGAGVGGWLLRRWLRPTIQMAQDWHGTPARPGVDDGRPGVMARLYSMEHQGAEHGRLLVDLAEAFAGHRADGHGGSLVVDPVHVGPGPRPAWSENTRH